ncbi:ankyrin repeat-containing domain protein [Mycena pura]|uniref:Ankyrin repeat-containing domain protein n=1 Tax=Mycena pura TaxID=153505 RepID=A0AAD6USV8_9AGAR|nr:ankyrin repeat-containing domain protein [Mycena pura]
MTDLPKLRTIIIQLIDTVHTAADVHRDLQDVPKEHVQLFAEVKSLQPLLEALEKRLTNNSPSAARSIEGPLFELKTLIQKYTNNVPSFRGANSSWNLEEAQEDLGKIERFKSLLGTWLTVDIWDEDQKQTRDNESILRSMQAVAGVQRQKTLDAQRQEILDWISPLDFLQRQADIFGIWQPGTGEWLLATPRFKQWESGYQKFLWCRGIPGAGKTVIASRVVNYLNNGTQNSNIGVACIYLNHKETESQTVQNLLGALLKQLVFRKPIGAVLHNSYELHLEQQTKPSLDELLELLKSALTEYLKAYLIIDGLDEYPEKERNVLLRYLAKCRASVLMTSRPHTNPGFFFPDLSIQEIRATEADISRYLEARIVESPLLSRHIPAQPELYTEIESAILNSIDGMFLLAKLHMDTIASKTTVKTAKEALQHLASDLRHTYNEAMNRIYSQSDDERQLAHQALTWVAYVKRSLSVKELQEALAIEPDTTALDSDNIIDIEFILSVCAGLITVDEKISVVRLIHYTTQEYLDSIQSHQFPQAQTEIVSACLTYMSYNEFSALPDQSEELLIQHPLLSYAQYCLQHAVGQPELELEDQLILFLEQASRWKHFWFSCSQANLATPWERGCSDISPLSISAAANLQAIVTSLLKQDISKKDKAVALYEASLRGYLNVAQLLVQNGVDINMTTSTRYGTALQAACVDGHADVAQLLIEHGADVHIVTGRYGTSLQAASANGHLALVQLLVERGADINTVAGRFGTSLQAACVEGNVAVAEFLLQDGADVNTIAGRYGTALHAACANGHEALVKRLLQNNAAVNSVGGNFGTALQAAAFRGYEALVILLTHNGADANLEGGAYGTPLQAASYGGHQAVVELLLENGADVNNKGGHYCTALQAASYKGFIHVVQLLIQHGADLNVQGGEYGTPLQAASFHGHTSVVQLLIENGAEINPIGGKFGTALQAASYGGNHTVVKLLIQTGAHIDTQGKDTGTALQAASHHGHEDIVKTLVDYGADVNAKGGQYGTALQAASMDGNAELVHFLIRHGANVNAIEGMYGTALQAACAATHRWGVLFQPQMPPSLYEGHNEVIKLLIDQGAGLNIRSGKFGSALQAAKANGLDKVIELLILNGADQGMLEE